MGLSSAQRMAASGAHLALCDLNLEAGNKAVKELSDTYPSQKFSVCSGFLALSLDGIS